MDWARILAYVTGTVDQELLARNEYLAAENRILKAQRVREHNVVSIWPSQWHLSSASPTRRRRVAGCRRFNLVAIEFQDEQANGRR